MPLPSYVDTERALLGALIGGSRETQEWVTSELLVGDFFDMDHQRAYKAVQTILDEGLEVSQVSVKDRGRLKQGVLQGMVDAGRGIAGGQVKTLIRDIRASAQLRSMASTFSDALQQCNGTDNPDAVLEVVETRLYGLDGGASYKASDARDVARKAASAFCDRMDGKGPPAISTGLKLLDRAILGLLPGKSYVVGARPAMGKSALLGTCSLAVLEQGYGVITFTGEMTEEDVINRALAYYADVNVRRIISGKELAPGEAARVMDAANKIPADRWRIVDRLLPAATVRRVARVEAAKMRRKGVQLGLVGLDYVQLYADGENREQAVAQVSGACKKMAKELDCPVIALSQLNRGLEHRDNKRPTMADLRESGSLEQDADAIIFLYRESVYDRTVSEEEAELIIGKNRDGPTGMIPVRFSPKTTSFVDAGSSGGYGVQLTELPAGASANVPAARIETNHGVSEPGLPASAQ